MNDFISNQWPNEMLMYEIRPGDTYEKIACEFKIAAEELTVANPCVNPNHLIPGQKLCIPRRQIRSCDDGCLHEVLPGENALNIAWRYNIALNELQAANPNIDMNDLKPTKVVYIPRQRGTINVNPCFNQVNACASQPVNPCTNQPINPCTNQPINPCSIQSVNPCTNQPVNPYGNPSINSCANQSANPYLNQTVNQFSSSRTYCIEKGDTLYSICKKLDIAPANLTQANPCVNLNDLHPGQSLCVPVAWAEYIHPCNAVRFLFPPYWQKITDERYEGQDGFFVATICCSGNVDLEKICLSNRVQLPGINLPLHCLPASFNCCHDNSTAVREGDGWAAVIIPFQSISSMNGQIYRLFILIADKNHIQEIARTVKFS